MISIILATKNGSLHIERAVRSVFRQSASSQTNTENEVELIIVDDASTDSTPKLIEELQKKDPRIKLITNKTNVGPGRSRHKGIQHSLGEYIAFIDDDDEWVSPEKLNIQKKFLEENERAVLVGASACTFISDDDRVLRRIRNPKTDKEIRSRMLLRNPFITSSVMLKKTAYAEVGGFSDLYLAEDYDLWMRLGKKGTMENLDGCDMNYTIHKTKKGRSNLPRMSLVILSLIKRYRNDYPHYVSSLLKAYCRILYLQLKHLF